ncbi:MAG: 50S ribosomal protein L23 [Saprospiraceae bacterium]|jgi:large subunit ribosomal protein L23|nr:50S ribosomal protein L23 [Candidatus Vicinibacter affinis]MBK7881488.1 50S ribosomal protein L23 [Candidatus Vicinibacter proximus]MBL7824032.1 50S ribosomal protein L23 [Saprospiraceae bacterium]MBK6571189.1 50S ribosomal protein L23 [Candidatus Vicinibacter affinis]MBK6822826.1 50S ribosomal protein L23 [Candidatus Vicinibacter affinis]
MTKQILVRPVITEKAEKLSSKRNQYTFIVHRDSNKIEIQKSVAATYNVKVESVNTLVIAGKSVVRNTKRAVLKGRKPAYKKAVVTLAAGEEINIFSEE